MNIHVHDWTCSFLNQLSLWNTWNCWGSVLWTIIVFGLKKSESNVWQDGGLAGKGVQLAELGDRLVRTQLHDDATRRWVLEHGELKFAPQTRIPFYQASTDGQLHDSIVWLQISNVFFLVLPPLLMYLSLDYGKKVWHGIHAMWIMLLTIGVGKKSNSFFFQFPRS